MIKDENYVNIQGFMLTKLGLSGASLIIYAVIYGFSQDDGSCFQGSRQYLADWCGCSISGVKKCLRQLKEAGLIEQVYHSKDNHEVFYRAIVEPRAQSDQGHKVTKARAQSDQGGVNKVPQAGAQSDQEDNIEDNLVLDNIAEKEEEETNTELLFDSARTRKEEVFDFIASHCPHVNPEGFYNYYQKLDWTQNGEPIKDWRRLAVTWEENMTKEAERLPFDEERKLWKQYEEKFGQKVPCQYFGIRWKYVQLAIATGVALKDE